MATYRYFLADALTGQLAEELPLSVSSYSQQINGVGTLTATLALGGLDPAINWAAATQVKRSLLVVQRDDVAVWGGLVMKRRPTDDGRTAELTAETLEGYLARRRIKTDLTQTGVDVFTIVRAIISQLQGLTGGNVRLATGSNTAGYVTTVTYAGKDRTKALDAINRLTEIAPGFEYTITWARSGQVFTPTLTLSAPGLNTGLDPVVLEYPGNVQSYEYGEDGGDSPNALTGVGADSGGTPLLAEVVDTTGQLAAGYPIFEDEWQAKDESDAARLASRTATVAAAKLVDYVVPSVVLRGDAIPGFADIPLGAPVRLRATSPYHPAGGNGQPGLDVIRRVTGWSVVPTPQERVTLTLAASTGKILGPAGSRDQNTYLRELDRRLRVLETA